MDVIKCNQTSMDLIPSGIKTLCNTSLEKAQSLHSSNISQLLGCRFNYFDSMHAWIECRSFSSVMLWFISSTVHCTSNRRRFSAKEQKDFHSFFIGFLVELIAVPSSLLRVYLYLIYIKHLKSEMKL